MAMDIIQRGVTSGNGAEVDANNNTKVNLPTTISQAGFGSVAIEFDNGSVTGTREIYNPLISSGRRIIVGTEQSIFNEGFAGTAINTSLYNTTVASGATVAVAGGYAVLTSGTTIAAAARLITYRKFTIAMGYPLRIEMDIAFNSLPITGQSIAWGFGPFGNGFSTFAWEGVYFRISEDGTFKCEVANNGTLATSANLNFSTLVGTTSTKHFSIQVTDDHACFHINDVLVAEITLPAASNAMTYTQCLDSGIYFVNNTATATSMVIKVGGINIASIDQNTNKLWHHAISGGGGHASQGQTSQTLGTIAQFANSANPSAAVPTNTTAALGTGLGGQFWETDTLAVTTDGIISSFQIPTGSATTVGKSLYITRITLQSFVQTALTGGPYVAVWSIAYGHTAVSLATAEAAATKAPRRMAFGIQPVTSAQAVSTEVGTLIDLNLDVPICVQPGEFFQMVKKKVGTAPTAGVIAHIISIGGYWE